ncbi:MAG: hypothetical protein ACYCZD_15445 [Rhodanobacter sp.]
MTPVVPHRPVCSNRPVQAPESSYAPASALLLTLLLAGTGVHAADATRFVERSLTLHGRNYRYQVFVPDGYGVEVHYTEYPDLGHSAWVPGYAAAGLWPWMFAHRLDKPSTVD